MSKARESAAGQPCALRLLECSHDPATTVLAHIRTPGTGWALKPPDSMGVYACSNCHDVIDGRKKSRMMQKEIQHRILCALAETHATMLDKGVMVLK